MNILMKTKLSDLKKDLLARVSKEVRSFDLASKLSPERRARLERQYSKLRAALTEVAEVVRQARKAHAAKVTPKTKTSKKSAKASVKRAPSKAKGASKAKATAKKSRAK